MLKRLLACGLLMFLVLAVQSQPAQATNAPVTCPPGQSPDPIGTGCLIQVEVPGVGGGAGQPGGDGSHARAISTSSQKCFFPEGTEIPCRDGDSWWSDSQLCYVSVQQPQPPNSDPVWEGHTDGTIYFCRNPFIIGTTSVSFWAATRPGGPAAPPDPRVLAQRAIAVMRLRAINIGIVPEPRPGSVGIIGFPTWMWAQAPDQSTWGPVTRSASAGGFTVTATAKVDRVVWTMGDGVTVVCTKPGTPYADSFGKASSPDCGHTYTRTGRYTVRATSHWVVTWAGIGQSGTIPLDFTNTTAVTMGEVQVLSQ
jgi:hypothetical protein